MLNYKIKHETIKHKLRKKLYKTDNWLLLQMNIKDKHKEDIVRSIYKKMIPIFQKKFTYRSYEGFKLVFLNFYVIYKNHMKDNRYYDNILTCHMSKSYYTQKKTVTNIPDILRVLLKNGYIERANNPYFTIGKSTGQCSKFIMLDKFKDIIINFIELCGNDIIEVESNTKPIILRKTINGKIVEAPVPDNKETRQIAKEVEAFNTIYTTANIELDVKRVEKFIMAYNTKRFYDYLKVYKWKENDTTESVYEKILNKNIYVSMPDLTKNQLHKVYTNNMKNNGRLHGHFLHNCPRQIQDMIKINGKNVRNLDFDCAHPNILSALSGVQLDIKEDFYKIDLKELNIHGTKKSLVERYLTNYKDMRKYIKECVLIMINASNVKEYLSACNSKGLYQYEAMIILQSFLKKYTWLKQYVCKGIGLKCMWYESNIMQKIMVKLMLQHGYVIIPMYDGCICSKDVTSYVELTMKHMWREVLNKSINVSYK